jgi:PcfJ-like protein
MTAVDAKDDLSPRQESAAARRKRRIEAFHPSCRRYVSELTCCAVELEDLADTFPALLFALVSRYSTPQKREHAYDLICSGAPLRQAADALGLAWWLRKLPAHAFCDPLPAFPGDREFCLHISNLIPRDDRLVPIWLARASHALEACDLSYALWIARQHDLSGPPEDLFILMAAWAWFSGRPGLTGHRLLRRPWTPEMSFKRAREELTAWRQRLRLIECLGPGIESPWLADGAAGGFEFVALRTVEDFIAESEALENCLDQYADQLHTGLTAVFSVRKGARRIACVEIGLHDEEVSMPSIVQLRAARNRRAPPEIWQATYSWLGSQRLAPLSPLRHAPKPMQRIEARRQLWSPYLQVLEATRHVGAFRRTVFHQLRTSGLDRRRAPLLAPRLALPRPTGGLVPARERS